MGFAENGNLLPPAQTRIQARKAALLCYAAHNHKSFLCGALHSLHFLVERAPPLYKE